MRLRSADVHVEDLALGVDGSTNVALVQIPKLYEKVMRCRDGLFLGEAEFGGSNQILVRDKRMLSLDLPLKPIQSRPVVGSA